MKFPRPSTAVTLAAAFLALFASRVRIVTAADAEGNGARPNIIVIMADDLGYGDTSVYDGWVKTPHLERMAAEGLTFTDFHSNSSVDRLSRPP